jgi:hypothetical protein
MAALGARPRLSSMTTAHLIQRVEVSFVGTPPVQRIERASGVSQVEIDGPMVRCLVIGSFQPFLEALRGYEVVSLQSRPVVEPASVTRVEGDQ